MQINPCRTIVLVVTEACVPLVSLPADSVNVCMDLLVHCVKRPLVSIRKTSSRCSQVWNMSLAGNMSPGQIACSQSLCQNGGTCQGQGLSATCICKPGFTGQRCEIGNFCLTFPRWSIHSNGHLFVSEFFRCQANGRFADPSSCKQGRYFECVYFGQCKWKLASPKLDDRTCSLGFRWLKFTERHPL